LPDGDTENGGGGFVSKDSIPEIGLQQIDAILVYLPVFEKQDYQFGRWVEQEGQFPYFSFSPEVDKFIGTLHEQNMIIPFDWGSWSAEAERYQSDPAALEVADLLTLRKLLTAHVRADRFTEGHLAKVLESGHITAILRRFKQIRDEMT
jgi:ADP-ribosyl-[dinitrogen reductase] hydrolase